MKRLFHLLVTIKLVLLKSHSICFWTVLSLSLFVILALFYNFIGKHVFQVTDSICEQYKENKFQPIPDAADRGGFHRSHATQHFISLGESVRNTSLILALAWPIWKQRQKWCVRTEKEQESVKRAEGNTGRCKALKTHHKSKTHELYACVQLGYVAVII